MEYEVLKRKCKELLDELTETASELVGYGKEARQELQDLELRKEIRPAVIALKRIISVLDRRGF